MYELRDMLVRRDGFTLQIDYCRLESGLTYAVVGPNGSGKTTLLDVLALQRAPESGELRCGEQMVDWDAGRATLVERRRRIAYLMQNPYLFSMTVADNIGYGLRLRGIDPAEIRSRVETMARRLSLETLLQRSARRLSGGEAQRVALARTLVLDADAYVLDEPTANVDRQHVHGIESLIRAIGRQRQAVVVLTTHSQEQAYRLSTHHISIFNGRLSDIVYENVLAGRLRREADGVRIVTVTGATPVPEGDDRLSLPPGADLEIKVAGGEPGPVSVAIDPEHLILSAAELHSSALNHLPGTVTRVEAQGDSLRVFVDVGVSLCARITARSYQEMGLNAGRRVWVTFKATAVRIL